MQSIQDVETKIPRIVSALV